MDKFNKSIFVAVAGVVAVIPYCLMLVPVAGLLNDLIYEFTHIIGRSCCPIVELFSGNKCEWDSCVCQKTKQNKKKT